MCKVLIAHSVKFNTSCVLNDTESAALCYSVFGREYLLNAAGFIHNYERYEGFFTPGIDDTDR